MAACQNRGVSASQTRPNGSVPTFRRRGGRLGPELRTVLAEVLPRFELPDPAATGTRWDLDRIFGGRDVVVEVGSGMGEAALELALARPDEAVIAVDVHVRGIASLARAAARSDLDNLRVVLGDGLDVLREGVAPEALAGIRAWFPDPWPKPRHHKRRLVRPDLVSLIASRLRTYGVLHVATDWEPYAQQMLEVLDEVHRRYGATLIMVTHNEAITAMADQVVELSDGRVVRDELNPHPVPAKDLDSLQGATLGVGYSANTGPRATAEYVHGVMLSSSPCYRITQCFKR